MSTNSPRSTVARATPVTTLLALFSLSLSAIRPILPTIPCSDDAAFHLLRLVQLDALIQEGVWTSRWAPAMANGYGFPIFNFYAPLSYYAAWLISLPVGDLNLGLRLTFAFGLFMAGSMMYLLAREFLSRPAAFVAAAAYIFAPYHGYDIYFRGNLAESFAWWLLPLTLWAFWRLGRHQTRSWVAIAAVCYAAVLLTHNVFALIFSPMLLIWAIAIPWLQESGQFKRVWPLLSAIGLGLALTAFFWVPALIEREFIHTEFLLVPPVFVYWGNFVTLSELFAGPIPVRADLINPSIPRTIGLVGFLIALPSLGALWGQHRRQRLVILGWVGLLATFVMMLSVSEPMWEAIPLLEFIQFPWRLLGVSALLLALLCGVSIDVLLENRGRWQIAGAVVAIILLALSSLYWFDPRPCAGLDHPTVADIVAFEKGSKTIGTTAKGEYLPITSDFVPEATALTPIAESEGITIISVARSGVDISGRVTAETETTLVVNSFDYPGWTATVDGQPVEITPRPGDGLITFPVPAGEHDIEVRFGPTPLRRTVNWISGLTGLALVGLFLSQLQFIKAVKTAPTTKPNSPHASTSIIVTGLTLLVLTTWLLPSAGWRSRLPALEALGRAVPYRDGLVLLDYRIASRILEADDGLDITLWWRASQPLSADYQARVELIDADGRVWSDAETRWPRIYRAYYTTRDWPTDQYAEEYLLATVIPGAPPGTYALRLVVFDKETLQPAPLADGRSSLELGTVEILRPSEPATVTPQQVIDKGQFGPIRLVGFDVDRGEADVGNPFTVTGYWAADSDTTADLTVKLGLRSDETGGGRIVWETDFPTVSSRFPTTRWENGDLWRGRYIDRIPADLPSGTYTWTLCVVGGESSCEENRVGLTSIEIRAPERRFDAPSFDQAIDRSLGNSATLVGATVRPCANRPDLPCEVELIWRAERMVDQNLRVFVHLIDANGVIVTQSDGEPAMWTRPTTSWVGGEYIVDTHLLAPPEGASAEGLSLQVGLYTPQTGRLTTPTGETQIELFGP